MPETLTFQCVGHVRSVSMHCHQVANVVEILPFKLDNYICFHLQV